MRAVRVRCVRCTSTLWCAVVAGVSGSVRHDFERVRKDFCCLVIFVLFSCFFLCFLVVWGGVFSFFICVFLVWEGMFLLGEAYLCVGAFSDFYCFLGCLKELLCHHFLINIFSLHKQLENKDLKI